MLVFVAIFWREDYRGGRNAVTHDCRSNTLKWQFAMYSLDQLILFGERSLAYVLQEYLAHHQQERNHQGLDNVIPFPDEGLRSNTGAITKSERLGGLVQFYYRKAA